MAEIQRMIERSTNWLLSQQDHHTGGWADLPGKAVNILNTAEVIIALLDAQAVTAGDVKIQKGIEFLKTHQMSQGPDQGAWPREITLQGSGTYRVPDIVRTSFAVVALVKAGIAVDQEPVEKAVEWLLATQKQDSGWGYSRGSPSMLMPTCFALMALFEVCRAGLTKCAAPATAGLELLVQRYHRNDGSFNESDSRRAVHTIHVVLVLQLARRCRLSTFADEEKQAIEWLRGHPDDARRLEEERITIDERTGRANYGFLVMTDSLLIRILLSSIEEEQRTSELARGAMISLRDKMDPSGSGGFYGYRVFSWSTAKVLSALSVASSQYQELPTRRPEYPGPKAGGLVFVLAVLLCSYVAYLSVINRLNAGGVFFFIFAMLALLLTYGRIGEKTFKELVIVILRPFQNPFSSKHEKDQNTSDGQ